MQKCHRISPLNAILSPPLGAERSKLREKPVFGPMVCRLIRRERN